MDCKKIMKFAKVFFLITLLCVFAVGCGSNKDEESQSDSTTSEVQQDSLVTEVPYKEYSNSMLYLTVTPAWHNATERNMSIYEFDERDDVLNFYTQDNYLQIQGDAYYVTMEPAHYVVEAYGAEYVGPSADIVKKHVLPSNVESTYEFKKATAETEYLYYGEFDDNAKPTGLGILFVLCEHEELETPAYMVKYAGYFKDGMYDGYGLEFESTWIDSLLTIGDFNNILVYNGNEFYEGYFTEGVRVLKGNYYTGELEMVLQGFEEISGTIDPYMINYDVISTEYDEASEARYCKEYHNGYLYYEGGMSEMDEYDGYGKLYVQNTDILSYEGDFKNGKKTGQGKIYSEETGNLIYEGELSNGSYHGKGILYDDSGRLIHEGTFEYGSIM